jgi:uncharacterized protein
LLQLSGLDSDNQATSQRSERDLASLGEEVVDAVLKSADEINRSLLTGYKMDLVLEALLRRIKVLGLTKSGRAVRMVSAAIADSSEMIHRQRQVMAMLATTVTTDPRPVWLARERLSLAKRLQHTALKALVQIGDESEWQLAKHMDSFSPIAQRAIQRALRPIQFRRFLVQRLLCSRAKVNLQKLRNGFLSDRGQSPDEKLIDAARNCDVGAVRAALAQGANPNAREPAEGQSPLHLCLRGLMGPSRPVAGIGAVRAFRSTADCEMIADVLLRSKADPNAKDNDGLTPLHWAAGYNLSNAAQSLLRSGANPNVADKMGITPLHQAAGSAAVAVARLLIDAGAKINGKTAEGATPLAYCENMRVFLGPDPFEPMRSLLRAHGGTG